MNYGPPSNPLPPYEVPNWDDYSWGNPETWDPTLALQRHPLLDCGFNSAPWNADEINGAGVEEPLWPLYFKATETYRPSVVDATDFVVFDCIDLTIRPVDDCIGIPAENSCITVRGRACHRRS